MNTKQKYIFLQLMFSLSDKHKHVCLCSAYPWLHHRGIGKCK